MDINGIRYNISSDILPPGRIFLAEKKFLFLSLDYFFSVSISSTELCIKRKYSLQVVTCFSRWDSPRTCTRIWKRRAESKRIEVDVLHFSTLDVKRRSRRDVYGGGDVGPRIIRECHRNIHHGRWHWRRDDSRFRSIQHPGCPSLLRYRCGNGRLPSVLYNFGKFLYIYIKTYIWKTSKRKTRELAYKKKFYTICIKRNWQYYM